MSSPQEDGGKKDEGKMTASPKRHLLVQEKENLDNPKHVEEENRKRTETTTFKLGLGFKPGCRHSKVEDACFCPMCQ